MRDIVLVDIDGTLCDCSHRVHHVQKQPKDWSSFYRECDKDKPFEAVFEIIKTLSDKFRIYFCTGRSNTQEGHDIRGLTQAWLLEHGIEYDKILFRPDGDHRHDTVVKKELVEKEGIKDRILFVLEDRNSVVKMWREFGLTCFQVAEGDF